MRTAFDITADLDTPVSAFLKLKPLHPRFLLESVEGGDRTGRYSFVGFGPTAFIRLDGTALTADGESLGTVTTSSELLDALRRAVRTVPRPGPAIPGVPLTGGLVGYTGYQVSDVFDPAPGGNAAGGDAAFMAPQSILVFDHLTRRAALMHDGSDAERAALRDEVSNLLRSSIPPHQPTTRHAPRAQSLTREEFGQRVERIKRYIAAGDVYQLVLSICFSGTCHTDPFAVYRALRLLNPSPYLYFCDFGDMAIVGSSPEALVRLQGRKASLRPIAGTRPRGDTDAEDLALEQDLVADPKEQAEHVMLVDLARNDLGRVAVPGTVRVHPFQTIERYSHVMHMVSGVEGVLAPDTDGFDLFAATFPAGTVVGAPKIRAREIIAELEPTARGVYAGTVGYFGHDGHVDQAIAIRTLVLRNGEYSYQAGAGIVADSVAEREYEEVLAKSAALEAALTMAEEGL